MKTLLPAASLVLSLCLAGCASFSPAELGQIRQRGVPSPVVAKFEESRELSPQDVIELTRRRVPEALIIRQIEDAGIDYLVTKDDIRRLRDARVSPAVLDALLRESDGFSRDYAEPVYVTSYGYDPYDEYYYGPRSSYPYGGSVGIGFSGGHHHHWHRRH